jgi:hypothetical protein
MYDKAYFVILHFLVYYINSKIEMLMNNLQIMYQQYHSYIGHIGIIT